MMTELEQERMQMIQESIGQLTEMLKEIFQDAEMPEGFLELVLGTILASIDAFFAIRDGTSWRGMTDPQEICRRLLREAQLGE